MQPTQSPGERPGLFSGKAVLLVSAVVLFIGVPVATWLTLRAVERDVKRTPLVYAERTSWQLLKARPETLDSANFITPVGESLRDTEFQLPPERRAIDLQAAKLAQSADFGSGSFSGTLPGAGGLPGEDFYPLFVASRWDDSDARAAQRDRAFELAPMAVVLCFVDEQGKPVADLPVGDVQLQFAQVTEGVLDDSLVLTYPRLTTDAQGRVYLPAYDAPLKLTGPAQADGRTLTWPREKLWMTWPGQVGAPSAIVVGPPEGSTDEHR